MRPFVIEMGARSPVNCANVDQDRERDASGSEQSNFSVVSLLRSSTLRKAELIEEVTGKQKFATRINFGLRGFWDVSHFCLDMTDELNGDS